MKQITLEEALKLVSFYHGDAKEWVVLSVHGNVGGNVYGKVGGDIVGDVKGNVYGTVNGDVEGTIAGDVKGDIHGYVGGRIYGSVCGSVGGHVYGSVGGTINGRSWEFIETPKEKFQRLLQGTRNQELIDTFNQLEDNS